MKAETWMAALSALALSLGGAAALDTHAATSQNLSTPGTSCAAYNAGQALDIDYLAQGVRNANAAPRSVVCPIVRHPVTGPAQTYYVDGSNLNGACTSCTVYAYNFTGQLLSSSSFNQCGATYDQPVSLPTVSFWNFVSVVCTLPASYNGVVFGAFAVDN